MVNAAKLIVTVTWGPSPLMVQGELNYGITSETWMNTPTAKRYELIQSVIESAMKEARNKAAEIPHSLNWVNMEVVWP